MTLRQEYARPRDRAIARHPGQLAQAAAPAHTGPTDVLSPAAPVRPAPLDPCLQGCFRRQRR